MLHIVISNPELSLEIDHSIGPLEFGRGPKRELPRQRLPDPYVSRDQLVIEELEGQRVRLENLSKHVLVLVFEQAPLEFHSERILQLPIRLQMGQTQLEISAVQADDFSYGATLDVGFTDFEQSPSLRELGASPEPETLAQWFESLICVQQAAATSAEFYAETTRAVINMVGLDRASVILREENDWVEAAVYTTELSTFEEETHHVLDEDLSQSTASETTLALKGRIPPFNQSAADQVLETGQTYFEKVAAAPNAAHPQRIEAVVAAPIFDNQRDVIGIVYGSRARIADESTMRHDLREDGITQLEAQVMQVLAAAVGAGLERERHQADAMRAQLQFEQFFSTKLAQELARDNTLLEGRQREVTIMFSDVRSFSLISEHLGPRATFRMMQDVMNLQTTIIHEFDGVVVDYVGDGLLAMWNAPTDQKDHAKRASRAVLAIMRALPELNDKWGPKLNRPLKLGIGLNTGMALVGNTGSTVKFKYGPMGPAVNIASRVEDATKQLGPSILITKSTHERLDETFATRRICSAALPGVGKPLDLYELSTEEPNEAWQKRREAFESALEHFHSRRWAETCRAIYPMIASANDDFDIAGLQLLSRAVECLKSNPDPFDPVVRVRSK